MAVFKNICLSATERQKCTRTQRSVLLHTNVCVVCATSMEMPVCVCDRCMIHSVTTVRRNDWAS